MICGVKDDKLNLIYEGNLNNNVAVSIPAIGLTKRISVNEKVTQGGPLGPAICAIHIDKICDEATKRENMNFKYKDKIMIPPLNMIDDVLTLSECGCKSVEMNSYINSQFELKNLTLNSDKCHQIHIGNQNLKCT